MLDHITEGSGELLDIVMHVLVMWREQRENVEPDTEGMGDWWDWRGWYRCGESSLSGAVLSSSPYFFARFVPRLLLEWESTRAMFGMRFGSLCLEWTNWPRYIIHYDLPKSMEGKRMYSG